MRVTVCVQRKRCFYLFLSGSSARIARLCQTQYRASDHTRNSSMHPGIIAAATPNKTAYVMADSGEIVTYRDLEATSNQGAHLFRKLGLEAGDHIAILLENHPGFLQICWAAQRSGIYYPAISWRLQQDEVEYSVNNCEARVFITSYARSAIAAPLNTRTPNVEQRYMLDGVVDGFESWESAIAAMPDVPIADETEGAPMLYSSGTTGYPKGVKKPRVEVEFGESDAVPVMTA